MRVSIITAALPGESGLDETRRSVEAQSNVDLEYIVEAANASSGSARAAARNCALRRASGDVVAYLDPGDRWEGQPLGAALRYFAASPSCRVVYGRVVELRRGIQGPEYPTESWNYENLLLRPICCRPAMFWRRDVAAQFGVFDERLEHIFDYEFWLRVGATVPFIYDQNAVWASCPASRARAVPADGIDCAQEALDAVAAHAATATPVAHWLHEIGERCAQADSLVAHPVLAGRARWRRVYVSAVLAHAEHFQLEIPPKLQEQIELS